MRFDLVDLTIITIFIPLQNTISATVFESRGTFLWIFLQKNSFHKILLAGTVVAFKNMFLVCCFFKNE